MMRFLRLALFMFLGTFISAMGFGYNTFEFWVILVTVILIQITAMVENTNE